MSGAILDAGALIALERADRAVRLVVDRAVDRGQSIVIPAGVLAQAWRSGRQARIAHLLRTAVCQIETLDERLARAAGELCGQAGTADVVDASVVLAFRRHRLPVLTSDPDDLRRLDPAIELVAV